MRCGQIGSIQMIVHPAMPVMLALLVFTHGVSSVCVMMGVLALHEAAHALCARALGVGIEQIEWMPFGGAVRLEGFSSLSGWKGALIAAAGPLANLLTILLGAACVQYGLSSVGQWQEWVHASAALMLVNLIPVLPMDGGRIVCALLSRWMKEAHCRRILSAMGAAMSLLLMGCGVYVMGRYGQMNMTLFLMGSYLLYAAVNEWRVPWYRQIENAAGRMRRMAMRSEIVPLREVVAADTMPVYRLAARLAPNEIYRIRVTDRQFNHLGVMDEADIVRAMLRNPAQSLGEVLDAKRKT